MTVTASDRQAAEDLRIFLADQSGFWHVAGDDGPLCQALARHREETEKRLLQKLQPFLQEEASRSPFDNRIDHSHLWQEERLPAQV